MLKYVTPCIASVSILFVVATQAQVNANVHEKVQEALDWQLPAYSYTRPKPLALAPSDSPIGMGSASSGLDSSNSVQGTTISYNLDTIQILAHERKEKRWKKCDQAYRDGLLADFVELKDSAQYGLTEQQAQAILAKLALIQSTILGQEVPTIDN